MGIFEFFKFILIVNCILDWFRLIYKIKLIFDICENWILKKKVFLVLLKNFMLGDCKYYLNKGR